MSLSNLLLLLFFLLLEPAFLASLCLDLFLSNLLHVLLELGDPTVAHNSSFLLVFFYITHGFGLDKEWIKLGHIFVFAKDFVVGRCLSALSIA